MMTDTQIKQIKNYPLAELTTLKIGGNAETAYFPVNSREVQQVRDAIYSQDKKLTVIGAGSNLLVSSKGISGGVIFTSSMKDFEISESGKIKASCGLKSVSLAKVLLENNLSGLEFLIGIPGSIGGAVTMNSSAHGQGIEDVIESVEVFDVESGEIKTLKKEELNLGYRYSFVESNKHLILNATFQLEKANNQDISNKMNFHVEYRQKNHPPLTEPNAGSTFRNPIPGVYVGKLFEELGAKDWVEGGVRVSQKHANFLFNTGNATSLDVSRLMHRMYNGVKEKYGYDLIAEIRFVGDATKEEEAIWNSFQVH